MSQNNETDGEELPDVPDELSALLEPEELENLRNLRGWSYARVAEVEDGDVVDTFEAWAEIFDGRGSGDGEYKGVRLHAVSKDRMEEVGWQDKPLPFETYGYASQEQFDLSPHDEGYYVEEYTHGSEVSE